MQDKRISGIFGEHILSKYQSNPVALVEAQKQPFTVLYILDCVITDYFIPQFSRITIDTENRIQINIIDRKIVNDQI